jgi:hypothetical protein
MENISQLNKFTWIFQFFGLQNFSLNTVKMTAKSKCPSILFLVIVILWLTCSGVFIYLHTGTFMDYVTEQENFLYRSITLFAFADYLTAVPIGVVFTLWDHSKLRLFFVKMQKILKLSLTELSCQVNYKKLRRSLAIANFVMMPSCLFYIVEVVYFLDFDDLSLIMVARIFIQIIILRFNFYVHLINSLLDVLCESVVKDLGNEIQEVSVRKEVWITSSSIHNRHRRIVIMRVVYKTIQEMTQIFNDTMGYLILSQIIVIALEMVTFVNLLEDFSFDNRHIYSE